jgi:hypothetical protein
MNLYLNLDIFFHLFSFVVIKYLHLVKLLFYISSILLEFRIFVVDIHVYSLRSNCLNPLPTPRKYHIITTGVLIEWLCYSPCHRMFCIKSLRSFQSRWLCLGSPNHQKLGCMMEDPSGTLLPENSYPSMW